MNQIAGVETRPKLQPFIGENKINMELGSGIGGAVLAEAENFFNGSGKQKVLAHSEILDAILNSLEPLDFWEVAGLRKPSEKDKGDTIPQKHLLVMVVNEILAKVKDEHFDLARKNDFIFAFNGASWKELDREVIKNFLGRAAAKMSVLSLEAQHYKFKNELYNQFLDSAYFKPVEPPKGSVLINLQNGTFEITEKSQFLRKFAAADFLTYQLPFEFDPNAECPLFDAYLKKVLPETELQNLVAEFLGYVFTKGLKMEKALLLYGSGANGKSVLFDVMNALLGKESISNFSLSNLLEEHNRALIAHKLLNYGSEINATKTRDEFKNLVSTEPIQARLKYGNSFTMEHYAKLMFNCNELPKDFDHSNAYFRRLLIIPFRVTIPDPEQDNALADKIINGELPGVFNWIIEGLRRLLKTKKFTASQIVKDTVESYKRESDSVACFIGESSYKPSATDYVLLQTLYADYRTFCTGDGASALKKSNFKQRLKSNGFQVDEVSNVLRVYLERVS